MPKCSLTHQKAEQRDFRHAVLSKPYKPVLCAATLVERVVEGYTKMINELMERHPVGKNPLGFRNPLGFNGFNGG